MFSLRQGLAHNSQIAAHLQSCSGQSCTDPLGVALMLGLLNDSCGYTATNLAAALEVTPDEEWIKPGWCQLHLSHLLTPAQVRAPGGAE